MPLNFLNFRAIRVTLLSSYTKKIILYAHIPKTAITAGGPFRKYAFYD